MGNTGISRPILPYSLLRTNKSLCLSLWHKGATFFGVWGVAGVAIENGETYISKLAVVRHHAESPGIWIVWACVFS